LNAPGNAGTQFVSASWVSASPRRIRVWDAFVRVFHWSTVALVILLVLTAHVGMEETHMALGIDLLVLLAARLVWGVLGTRHARFVSFWVGPKAGLRYLGEVLRGHPQRYVGHNPAGGWMVLALLGTLSVALVSGLLLQATLEFEGPFAGVLLSASDAFVDSVREVHRQSVHVLYGLVPLHVIGVVLASAQHRENLTWSMVTGYKSMHGGRMENDVDGRGQQNH
jgi:cytochrome b